MSIHGFRSHQLSHHARHHRRGGAPLRSVAPALIAAGARLRSFFSYILQGGAKRVVIWAAALVVGGGILFLLFVWFTLPDIQDPRNFLASQSTVVVDRNGVELYRFFQEEDRTYVEGTLLPQDLKDAIVAIEDERFYERGCLDVIALARVVFRFGQAGGASTLTRQLARNALDLQHENIVSRKIKELVLGCQMEHRFGKDELITLYLNWIPFGQNAYGAAQASKLYFGTEVQDLTLAKAAVLAALPQRPSYFNPYGLHRYTQASADIEAQIIEGKITSASQIPEDELTIGLLGGMIGTGSTTVYVGGRTDQVLRNMQDQEFITEQERLAALEELETLVFEPTRENIRAPHFVLWVRDQMAELLGEGMEAGMLERGGMQIETTLDWDMQQAAELTVAKYREDVLTRFGGHNIALVALQPGTREILAYVGNADYNDEEHGGKIDMVRVPRQPGSSFKPFVYAKAFENGYGPATVLFDVKTKFGDDEPQNFDGGFWGPLTIRQALGASRNIPAAKAFFLAGGEDNILRLVASMGAPSPLARRTELAEERGEFDYGWPLALGAAETPLIEMTNAYATFGDAGVYKPVVAIRSIKDKNGNLLYQADPDTGGSEVLDKRIAYQITSILSDESVRPTDFWKSRLTIPGYQTAAKTGTSNKCLEWKENNGGCVLRKPDNAWVLGFTPNIVAGVWSGNADSSAMFEKADGLNTSSAIWQDFLIRAHKTLEAPVAAFPVPEGLVQPQVSMLSGELPTECTPVELRRADIFLNERAPTKPDPACVTLMVDKVTGLLASDACPEDAREEKSFYDAHDVAADRWPLWEAGVQAWMKEQMVLWNATETHTGSVLKLPQAPTEQCDPSLTPGRLVKPTLTIESPKEGGMAAYPAFSPEIEWTSGAAVREIRFELDGRRVAVETEPPYQATIRVPRSVDLAGTHELVVTLEDEYFNKATATVQFRFGEDEDAPQVRLLEPSKNSFAVGEDIRIRAEADDAEGGIKYVQFYLNDTLLTTKPSSPYSFEYTLDVPAGVYTLRAVAEDVAGHQSEDEMQIGVGGAVVQEQDDVPAGTAPSAGISPSIITPAGDVQIAAGDVTELSFRVPAIDGRDIRELRAVIVNDETGIQEEVLSLMDGEGLYRRQWMSKTAGSYTLTLTTEDRSQTVTEWGTRTITVQ
jgi:membrane peptidoglycan carboxypeptidase